MRKKYHPPLTEKGPERSTSEKNIFRRTCKSLLQIYTFQIVDAPSELFGNKWDKEDPLAQDDYNQNLLAWFGFEETLRNIGYNFETLQDCI